MVEQDRGRYGRRHPRPGLTPATIVSAGRRLIERDGLDALTMRAVAAELNTAATSLYRHVEDREALLLAILEEIAEGMPTEVKGDTPHERLLTRLLAAHAYLGRHIWVVHVLISGEYVATNAFAFTEACLADLVAAGHDPRSARLAYSAAWQLLVGELLTEHPLTPPSPDNQRARALASLDPARYPLMAETRDNPPDPESRHASFRDAMAALLSALLPPNLTRLPQT